MDTARGIDHRPDHDGELADVQLSVGGDERRMHVRAYNYWVSLLHGRAFPSIEDLDPASIADFGAHSVLLDFTRGIEHPHIQFLGRSLREECAIDHGIESLAEVPSRSLLSRLTDHYLQIIANRAPIGFEAEFVGTRGHNTFYRGILMPFSSDGEGIDFIYGVINWKEMVDAATQASLTAELEAARHVAPVAPTAPVWADGPGAGFAGGPEGDDAELFDDEPAADDDGGSLADRLDLARTSAEAARAADGRSRAALYRALARAYAFARATESAGEDYAELLADAGLKVQARAPMTPVVKLVFGIDYDKTRLTEFAAVLAHALRHGVPGDAFAAFLDAQPGGIKGAVAAERALRRPAPRSDRFAQAAAELRGRPPLARVDMPHGDAGFVVLLARGDGRGSLEVISCIADEALARRTILAAA